MGKILYTADLHLGHGNIIRLCNRPFYTVDEMNRTIIENWNSCVKPEDDIYIIGDFSYKSKENGVGLLQKLNGSKHLIIGNHDKHNLKDPNFRKCFVEIKDMLDIMDNGRRVIMCHYPMIEWDGYFRGSYLVYGHIHNNVSNYAYKCMKELDNALNAGIDINQFMPVTLNELIINNKIFKENH